MKKILYLVAVALTSLTYTSCSDDYLDVKPDDSMDQQQVFERFTRVDGLVTRLYDDAKSANRPLVYLNHFSSSAITDECEGSNVEKGLSNLFNSGAWSADGMPESSSCGQYWADLWTRVRRCNIVFEGVKKYKTPDLPGENNVGVLNKRLGEVFFFRAYFHFLLLRSYGEIPYLDYTVDPQSVPVFQKESVHSVIAKICQDCDSAYARVPERWFSSDFGRIEKGMCLGLKAMAKWVGATPLWNGGVMPAGTDTRLFGAQAAAPRTNEYIYKAERWVAARDAAAELINFKLTSGKNRYSLYYGNDTDTTYVNDKGVDENNAHVRARLWKMFHETSSFQQEWVFFVTNDKWDAWQGDLYPPSAGGGARQMPMQEQVDEYEYIAPDGCGYPVYSANAVADGYDDANPYEGIKRDPRLYRDIIYHGCTFKKKLMNTATGANKIGANNATKTGYYLRKFMKEGWASGSAGFQIHGPAIWRLPEFVYIYAEAVNELNTEPKDSIYNMINTIRARSFMAPMPAAVKTDKALMQEYIQRERRIELFYENNRVWNTRLYMDADEPKQKAKEAAWFATAGANDNERSQNYWAVNGAYPKTQRMVNGMKPIEDAAGKIVIDGKKYRMSRIFVETRVFVSPRHYLFPIMNDELKRLPKTFPQNPGW